MRFKHPKLTNEDLTTIDVKSFPVGIVKSEDKQGHFDMLMNTDNTKTFSVQFEELSDSIEKVTGYRPEWVSVFGVDIIEDEAKQNAA